jgi:sialidase-1
MYHKFNWGTPVIDNFFQYTGIKKILGLCLLIIIASGFQNKKGSTQSGSNGKETVFKTKSGLKNPRNTEGDFVTLKDGRILFIYTHFTNISPLGTDWSNACLMSRYSDDNGKTWSKKDKLVVKQEGTMNVMSVSLLRMQNDEIALFYLKKNSMSDCIPYMRISTDEAKTWSEPIQCISDRKGYFVVNNNRVIKLKNGRLLMPAAYHPVPEGGVWGKGSDLGHIYCYYSDDYGRTWRPGKEVPNPDDMLAQEPGVVELKNGDILMYIRNDTGFQYLSYSKDKGETWSPAEKSNIKSPLSPASMARVPSTGDLLMVWNNRSVIGEQYRKRSPFNIAISKDEGKTWTNIKTIEDDPDGNFCYGAIHFTKNHVLIAYGVWTEYINEYITRISLDWIYK